MRLGQCLLEDLQTKKMQTTAVKHNSGFLSTPSLSSLTKPPEKVGIAVASLAVTKPRPPQPGIWGCSYCNLKAASSESSRVRVYYISSSEQRFSVNITQPKYQGSSSPLCFSTHLSCGMRSPKRNVSCLRYTGPENLTPPGSFLPLLGVTLGRSLMF